MELFRPCMDAYFSSLNFRHSSLITYFKILHPFGTITQYFSHYLWAPCLSLDAVFFFFFFLLLRNLNQKKKKKDHRTQWKKKKKRKKKEEEHPRPNPGKKRKTPETEPRKKKRVDWSKGAAKLWLVRPPCVFNYKNVIELWVMKTEKS